MGPYNKSIAAIMVGAFMTVVQVMIKAVAPDHFWSLVQNNTEFWGACYTLVLGLVILLVPNSKKEPD
jgi:hypothetical protein